MSLEPVPVSRRGRIPPNSLEAEESLLGAMMLSRQAIETATELEVHQSDFYKPMHGDIYAVLVAMYERGESVDPVTVADEMRRADRLDAIGGRQTLLRLQVSTPASANARSYARTVLDCAGKRRLIEVAGDISEASYDPTVTYAEAASRAADAVLEAERPIDDLPAPGLDEFMNDVDDERWMIPGLIEEMERIIIVAGEGAGKTTLLRQVAVAASQGLHPFMPQRCEPIRVLYIDLENPPRLIRRELRRCLTAAREECPADLWNPSRCRVILRPEGMDVTRPQDARWLLGQVRVNKPQLICLGPLYQLHESEEEKSSDVKKVIRLLNRVRTMSSCALLMETHAPHESFRKDGGGLRPAGSRLWVRWPDRILGLNTRGPDGKQLDTSLRALHDVRPPRFPRPRTMANGWPTTLEVGTRWPWERT